MMAISFKGAHFPKDIILMGVRWYVAYPLSYRHVEELMEERGGTGRPRDHPALGREIQSPHWRKRFIAASGRCGSAGAWTRPTLRLKASGTISIAPWISMGRRLTFC